MTVKFSKAGSPIQYFSAADAAKFTFPTGGSPYVEFGILTLDGDTTGTSPQYLMSTGALGAAGSRHIVYNPGGVTTSPNKLLFYRNTGTTPSLTSSLELVPGKSYFYAIQQDSTSVKMYICEVLSTAPVNGSTVVMAATIAGNSVALDSAGEVIIGGRGDKSVSRALDNSIGRLGGGPFNLSTLEMEQMAAGKRITEMGKTVDWQISLDTANDFDSAIFTKNGAPTTSTAQPAFFYGTAPAAPASPVISGAPTINTTPIIGTAVGYTPATVTAGTPTRTQQWTLDGVDILGATGATYTPVAGDAGKALRVRQIETVTGATPSTATATSAPQNVTVPTSNTVTGTAMPAERIYQRSGTSLAIAMSGAYTGAVPTAIEYQLYAEDGTTVLKTWAPIPTLTVSGGNWSGTPAVPQGGMYRRQVRAKNGTTVIATGPVEAELFGVGVLMPWTGSSSAQFRFTSTSGSGYSPYANVRKYTKNGGWAPFGSNGAAILEANAFADQAGVPVGLIDCGLGGTSLAGWLNTGAVQWTTFLANLAAVGGKVEAILLTVGSNDASAGSIVSAADHAANLRLLIQRMRDAAGNQSLPILLSGMNRRFLGTTGGSVVTDEQANFVHTAENEVGDDANITHVQTLDLAVLASDGTHLTTGSGYPASCARNGYVFGRRLFGDGVYARGPKILSIEVNGMSGKVTIQHRNASNDITPSSGITGFNAFATDGSPVAVTAARLDATHLALTFSETPNKVRYLGTANPDMAGQIYDNGDTPLPTTSESVLPINVVAEAPTTGSFSSYQLTSSGTLRANQECTYTWFVGGVIGDHIGPVVHGVKMLDPQARLTVGSLPLGPGFMLMKFPNGGIAYQAGSVA